MNTDSSQPKPPQGKTVYPSGTKLLKPVESIGPPPKGSEAKRHILGGYLLNTPALRKFAECCLEQEKVKPRVNMKSTISMWNYVGKVLATYNLHIEATGWNFMTEDAQWLLVTRSIRARGAYADMELPFVYLEGKSEVQAEIKAERLCQKTFDRFGLKRGEDYTFETMVL